MKEPDLRILSLGAGIQSTTLYLMSCRGDLPPLDCAIFADTQWEPQEVYDHLAWLETFDIPIHRVTAGNVREAAITQMVHGKNSDERYATMPIHVLKDSGPNGLMPRQCTRDYKVNPKMAKIRKLLGVPKGSRPCQGVWVEQWFGISADETKRVRTPDVKWMQHRYPLVYELRMTRSSCIQWLEKHYPHRPIPRSCCIGCPFKSNREWRLMKARSHYWNDACEVDQLIRHCDDLDGQAFLHRSCTPLRTANLDEDQAEMWPEECLGICGT